MWMLLTLINLHVGGRSGNHEQIKTGWPLCVYPASFTGHLEGEVSWSVCVNDPGSWWDELPHSSMPSNYVVLVLNFEQGHGNTRTTRNAPGKCSQGIGRWRGAAILGDEIGECRQGRSVRGFLAFCTSAFVNVLYRDVEYLACIVDFTCAYSLLVFPINHGVLLYFMIV